MGEKTAVQTDAKMKEMPMRIFYVRPRNQYSKKCIVTIKVHQERCACGPLSLDQSDSIARREKAPLGGISSSQTSFHPPR
jgi:hypothetical protein